MEELIDGIPVTVICKRIKNLHLYVKAPDGRVVVTMPVGMKREIMLGFVLSKTDWIRKKQAELILRPQPALRQYVTGESLYLWGEKYRLEVVEGRKYRCEREGSTVFFTVRPGSSFEQREKYMHEWYRGILKERILERLPLIEAQTGLHCSSWQTKNMTTRWGTCNTRTKKIWLNLQLAKKPPVCLDYVLLHELVHTRISNHGPEFAAMMSRFMPEWKEIRQMLNGTAVC